MRRPSSQLGQLIRQQRQQHRLTLREFARMTGVSNPYLSQIERGLRDPSDAVIDAIARTLQTSADALYEQIGVHPNGDREEARTRVEDALESDVALTPRQRRVILDVYDAMVAAGSRDAATESARLEAGEAE